MGRLHVTVLEREGEEEAEEHFLARCRGCMRRSPGVLGPEERAEKQLSDLGWAKLLDKWACPVCQTRHSSGHRPRTR